MGQRFLLYPYRDMTCDDCERRGLPHLFFSHLFGTGHDHVCPPLSQSELEAAVRRVANEMKSEKVAQK